MSSAKTQTKNIKIVYHIYLSIFFMWTQDKFLSLGKGQVTDELADYDSKYLCPNYGKIYLCVMIHSVQDSERTHFFRCSHFVNFLKILPCFNPEHFEIFQNNY